MRILTAVCTTGLTAAVVLAGAHVAGASTNTGLLGKAPGGSPVALVSTAGPSATPSATATSTPTGITLPAGGVLEKRVIQFCDNVPALIKRADAAQTRLSADAETKGSLARLKGRVAKAEKNNHPKVAKRLRGQLDRRTTRLTKLPDREKTLSAANAECTTVDLPLTHSAP